jgi:hypothetical protein
MPVDQVNSKVWAKSTIYFIDPLIELASIHLPENTAQPKILERDFMLASLK